MALMHYTPQVALRKLLQDAKRTMYAKKKDAPKDGHRARLKKPESDTSEIIHVFEFARIYYAGP
jgi:hypothetical protein